MKWFHVHNAARVTEAGANEYWECKCGARRTFHVYYNLISPILPGWPRIPRGKYSSGWEIMNAN